MILGSIIEGEVTIYYMLFALVCLLVLGLILGKKFGTKLSGKATIFGGCILVFIGIEIFIKGFFF